MRQMARSGRQDRNRRLRAAFTSQTAAQLREWAALLSQGGEDVAESVAVELEQTAERADALTLTMIAVQCRAAAARVRGGIIEWSIRPLIHALATYGHQRAFPSMVVIADPDELPQIKESAAAYCEPLVFLSSAAPLAGALQCDPIQGVLLPKSQLDRVEDLEQHLDAPIYVYGDGSIAERLAAAEHCAAGWVNIPIPLDVVLRRQRRDTWRAYLGHPRILVVGDSDDAKALAHNLETHEPPMHVRVTAEPTEILDQLAEVAPEMVVLGAEIGGKSGYETLAVIWTDAEAADLPVAVLGDASWAQGGLDGAHGYSDVETAAKAVRHAVTLTHTGAHSRDRVTGVHSRPSILASLDRELARSRRSNSPVTAVAVAVDNLDSIRETVGPARADQGLRLTAAILMEGVRHYDLVGRVTADTFLICMPDCPEQPAVARLELLYKRFKTALEDYPDLAPLTWSVGITDSEHGHAQLLRRVDDALERARAAGRAGVITT